MASTLNNNRADRSGQAVVDVDALLAMSSICVPE
jgi:hypothetical protein